MKETETIKNRVLSELEDAFSIYISEDRPELKGSDFRIRLEYSRNEKFGDYSSSAALENKNLLGNPVHAAEAIVKRLKNRSFFSDVNFTPPGFINFRISETALSEYLKGILQNEDFRFPKTGNPEKIIFEFVSANPTGPLNIVSARAGAAGDSICSLLERIGHSVQREFYVNDYGNQVFLLGVSCVLRLLEWKKGAVIKFQEKDDGRSTEELLNSGTMPSEAYRGEYIADIAKHTYSKNEKEIETLLSQNRLMDLAEKYSRWAVEYNLSLQKQDLENFGIRFDQFFSERTLHESGKVLSVLKNLEEKDVIYTEDGKKVFASTKYGDDKDRVVLREDGRPTYLLADIAYHKSKMDRGFKKMLNIWGPDHHGYIARLHGAVQALGYPEEAFRVLIAQQVNLLSKGEVVKMSKRLGRFQTMKDLTEFLGKDSRDLGRYFFVLRALETHLDFDLDLAKEESDKNPVYYLQYAHARIRSIFRTAETEGDFESFQSLKKTEERERLMFWCARFPEEVYDAAQSMEPHRLCVYLQNLAKAFSKFYIAKDNKIIEKNDTEKRGLAFLCSVTAMCLKEGLAILGISAPEIMERQVQE